MPTEKFSSSWVREDDAMIICAVLRAKFKQKPYVRGWARRAVCNMLRYGMCAVAVNMAVRIDVARQCEIRDYTKPNIWRIRVFLKHILYTLYLKRCAMIFFQDSGGN